MLVTVADDVPETTVGDRVRLQQVLTNLVGNAVKFTAQGTVELRVTTDRSGITFTVTDTGIGIPVERQDLLFKPFSQVDDSSTRSYGGTGLGLAISQELVTLMGGTITLESTAGHGCTFSFTLPRALSEPPLKQVAAAIPSTGSESDPPSAGGAKPRILIVEDDPLTMTMLQALLNGHHYITETANNGHQALQMWEHGSCDLIIMDVQLPVLDGIKATRAIRDREREHGGHVPILAITAQASPDFETQCLAAGMDGYLAKPVDLTEVLRVVAKLLLTLPVDKIICCQ